MRAGVAVSVTDLTVRRGRLLVFDHLNVTIAHGRITGLLGPSGSGKTTLMRSIVGLQRIASGEVRVFGDRAGTPNLRSLVAYGTQETAVYDDLTVRQNLSYLAAVTRTPRHNVDLVIDEVGLGEEADRLVANLSGGQVRRVSLAMALISNPRLLVLDEPTVGLDPVLRGELWSLFRELCRRGVTIIVSSHVMDEALRCDDLTLMRDGRIIAETTPADLLRETGATDPEAAFLSLIRVEEHGVGQ